MSSSTVWARPQGLGWAFDHWGCLDEYEHLAHQPTPRARRRKVTTTPG